MFLENVVSDATDPHTVGRFWEAVLDGEQLTDEDPGYETRVAVPGGPALDLGFQRVPTAPDGPQRLRYAVQGGEAPEVVVERLVGLGASPAGESQGDLLLTDPAGSPFHVVTGPTYGARPLAALRLDVADPIRERAFWSWLTGWVPIDDGAPCLRHPCGRGPVLELRSEAEPKVAGKNRMHLDIRLEPTDDPDALAREISGLGGRELHFEWGDLPWRHFADPSGNEFCLLPSR